MYIFCTLNACQFFLLNMVSAIQKYLPKNDTGLGTYNVLYIYELHTWSCGVGVRHILAAHCLDRICSCMHLSAIALLWSQKFHYCVHKGSVFRCC